MEIRSSYQPAPLRLQGSSLGLGDLRPGHSTRADSQSILVGDTREFRRCGVIRSLYSSCCSYIVLMPFAPPLCTPLSLALGSPDME
jgi:hypothetical protein